MTERQLKMLTAFNRIHDYLPLSLGDLIDPDYEELERLGLIESYMGMGASQRAKLTDAGRKALEVHPFTA